MPVGSADMASGQIRFVHHNESMGLSSNEVHDILQCRTAGLVWMATSRGLNQFDVHNNRTHRHDPSNPLSLSSDRLTCLALGLDGAIWVGTADQGLNRFDQHTETVIRLVPNEHNIGGYDASKLNSPSITALANANDSQLWVGTKRGLAVLDMQNKTIARVKGPLGKERISSITTFGDGDVWVGTAKGRVFRWDAAISEFEDVCRLDAPITAVCRDDDQDGVWVGTEGSGLFRLDSQGTPTKSNLKVQNVTEILVDENGIFWVGSTQGLIKFNVAAGAQSTYRSIRGETHSLSNDHVSAAFQDKQRQMIWIATKGGGTSRFSLDDYYFPLVKDGVNDVELPNPSIASMTPHKDGKSVWMGTERGVFRWSVAGRRPETELPGLDELSESYAISLLEDSKGTLWVGTKGAGLYARDPDGTVVRYANQNGVGTIGHNYINSIVEGATGSIWVGTYGGGVYRYSEADKEFKSVPTKNNVEVEFINDFHFDEEGKKLWIASDEGIYVWSEENGEIESARNFIPNEIATMLNDITSIIRIGRFLWVGTDDKGLCRIDLESDFMTHLRKAASDLPEDHIVNLSQDSDGYLWVATSRHLSRLENIRKEIKFRNFFEKDGLQPGDFSRNAVATARDSNGVELLLFGGNDGFNPINPQKFPQRIQTPRPLITGFEHFGVLVKPGPDQILEKPIASTSELRIPFDDRNQFAFKMGNLDYRFPRQGYFRYKMEGLDKEWKQADASLRASYQSIPVGNYNFMVENSTDGEKWNKTIAQLRVKIIPPFYQTWWFRIISILALLILVFCIVRTIFANHIKAIERREATISAERDRAEVALARQLQHAVLIERTSHGLHQSSREDEIFTAPLKNLVDHFGVEQGIIYRAIEAEEEEAETTLKQITSYHSDGSDCDVSVPLQYDDAVVTRALGSETAFIASISDELREVLAELEGIDEFSSVIFSSTRFLDRPNGVILLLSQRPEAEWHDDEIKLINALSPQFGISISQLSLAEKEQHYMEHLEEAKHQAEVANRAKSDFLAKMTHELRTPLNSIIGFTEIVQEDESLTPRQRELIEIVNSSGDHLLDVINDILDLSKIEAGKIEKVDETFELTPLLKSVYDMLSMKADAKNIGFEFSALSPLPDRVFTDRSKVRQTLLNLMGNAIKFTDKGAVTLSVSAVVIGEPFEAEDGSRRKLRLSFQIQDTGKGISKEDLPKLFEKYGQTESGLRSSEGTGLGLPIARSFIQLMGGDIDVQSEYGKGTTFYFYIECDEVAPDTVDDNGSSSLSEDQAQKVNGLAAHHDPVKILIAEDMPNNRLLLKKILGKAGFEMCEAHNGKEAVEKCAEWQPDLILMDENMPVMTGTEATREIKGAHPDDGPIIVSLTAYALEQAKQAALEAGCADFLAKPFKAHEIFSCISRHLELEYTFSDS